MNRLFPPLALLLALLCGSDLAAQPGPSKSSPSKTSPEPFVLGPPPQSDPVIVKVSFSLSDINEINEGTETFEFAGVLTLTWRDPRQAFDPAVAGTHEKIFQGAYQVNEVSPSWYPQVVLINEAGSYQKSGTLLRVQPDGTSTLVETVTATAESEIEMTRFPFDRHRLEAVFEVLDFDKNAIRLQPEPQPVVLATGARVPQWSLAGVQTSVQDRTAQYPLRKGASSVFVVSANVERRPFYAIRLVVFPLMVIALLSFSVFWMDRSSLGDRISVSFIGVLTAVAYQLLTNEQLPRISYVTLMHGFVNLSFLTMCATVVINLVVGTLDKRGQFERGNRIDHICRWAFPLGYLGLLLFILVIALVFY